MFDQQNNFLLTFIDFNELFKQHANLHPVYYQLGFICSVQAQPEQLDLEQWLPYLWLEDADISFNDQQQAADYAKELLSLVAKVQERYQQAVPLGELQSEQWINEQNGLNECAIHFATGFLAAIEIFNTQWLIVEQDQDIQNLLQTTILLLTKLAPNEEIEQSLLGIFEQLPEFTDILAILPELISKLAYSAQQIENKS